jgi:predicted alpha/beta hydrolase
VTAEAQPEKLALIARDGYRLGATLYRAAADVDRVVLVMAATGVPQEYYGKFATYLAERNCGVLTFDYRGIGRSLHSALRDVDASMEDWALLDGAAALDFLEHEFSPERKVSIVGHSFGGQSLGLLPRRHRIRAALIVGSQSGYWRKWPLLGRAWMWPATHLLLPIVPRLPGYLPMARYGFGEDLPAGVAIQWASWCRDPLYLVGALGVQAEFARSGSARHRALRLLPRAIPRQPVAGSRGLAAFALNRIRQVPAAAP